MAKWFAVWVAAFYLTALAHVYAHSQPRLALLLATTAFACMAGMIGHSVRLRLR